MTSTRDESVAITLGGETFTVSALTLDQLQEVAPQLDAIGGAGGLAQKLGAVRDLIAVATGTKKETLGALKVSLPELFDAIAAVTKVTGLEELKNRAAAAKAPSRQTS